MNARTITPARRLTVWFTVVSLVFPWPFIPSAMAQTTPLALSPIPLFVSTGTKPNVLLILDNSNSMDEDATGAAVGSAASNSKSEIARGVAKSIVATYTNKINMGLMAYKQNSMVVNQLHNSPYDVSFDPANYDSTWTGNRASATHKKFSTPNPTSPGNSIYYNVALPFYSSSNQGTAFCYSNTADASSNTAHPDGFWAPSDSIAGPWDNYRCYSAKTGTSDTLPSSNGSNAATYGWTPLAFTGAFSPTDSDIAQNIVDFGRFTTYNYVGPTWFVNTSPGRGYLHTPIGNLDSAQASKLNTKLGTSQFTNNKRTDAAYPLQNGGLTPIEGTLLTAKDYFGGSWSSASEGYTASCYPLPESCGKKFVVLVTDGLPSTDKDGHLITSAATALSDAATAATALKTAGVETYVVGFALPYGTEPTQLNTIASAGGTGAAYSANDQASLNTALGTIFADILAKSGSAAAVATNSTSLNSSSAIYQAKFDPSDWSGQLLAYVVGTTGVIPTTPTWDAAAQLPAYSSRNIITYKPSTRTGIAFQWPADPAAPTTTEMDSTQSLGASGIGSSGVLDYLRGYAFNEGSGSTNYRARTTSKLGDIANSSPIFVGKPASGYADTIESTVAYSTFVTAKTSRTSVLYAGANDGMLHGFRASDGVELLGYVPSSVYPNLYLLSTQTYTHRYYVDGSPSAADVFYGGAWHTVLVGGLNGGGQGIYAIDITDPTIFTEANSASLVLWEFTDRDTDSSSSTNTNFDSDLGYTYSQPAIGKMHNGSWVAIFGNGYNNTTADGSVSSSGNAVLYIVDIQTGQLIKKLDTKKGTTSSPNGTTPNGLASPAVVDVDGDEIIDYIYAGDLQGNLWKFDVTNSGTNQWGPAYGNSSNPAPLFTARMGTTPQPITERPEVGEHPEGGYFIYFGTGKYIETGDNVATGATTQSFYGIWDNGAAVGNTRTSLLQQQILAEVSSNGEAWRLTSNNTPTWTGGSANKGWYLDLYNTQGGNTNNYGEKQVSNPVLSNKRLIFTTLIPASGTCTAGGDSWLMELNPETGGRLGFTPFDVNGDNSFSSADYLSGGTVTTNSAVGGRKLTGGIAGTPAIMYDPSNKTEIKYFSQSSGQLKVVKENPGGASGRVSWREIVGSN